MNSRIKPSISMLPMEDIAKYLNLIHGFKNKSDISPDTLQVSGIDSDNIAICYNPDDIDNPDRETVLNAMNLNGIPYNEYITKTESETLLLDTYKVGMSATKEIQDLRDELYQIKADLAKNGYIPNHYSYHGMQEAFKNGDKLYIDDITTTTSITNYDMTIDCLTVNDISQFTVGEYIVVCNSDVDSGEESITRITAIDKASNVIDISPALVGPIYTHTEIKKTLGFYHKGSFVFGKEHENELKIDYTKERHIILNDDSNECYLDNLALDKSSYITTFTIPKRTPGTITNIQLQAAAINNPGNLICSIIKIDSDIEKQQLLNCTTYDDILNSNLIIASSQSVPSSMASTISTEINFKFESSIGVPITAGERYALMVTVLNSSNIDTTQNYWKLIGLQGNITQDLHSNIKLFRFDEGFASTECIGKDLWFGVTINEFLDEEIIYKNQGLYSAKVSLPIDDFATRARVELKINREGLFKSASNVGPVVLRTQGLRLDSVDNKYYPSLIFKPQEPIIIDKLLYNTNIIHANTNLSLDTNAAYVPLNSEVYRLGYKAQIIARKIKLDLSNTENPIIEELPTKVIELDNITILPGKDHRFINNSSDRILFEKYLSEEENLELIQYNDFTIQVYWDTPVPELDMYNHPELAGRIYDLVVTLDKPFTLKDGM